MAAASSPKIDPEAPEGVGVAHQHGKGETAGPGYGEYDEQAERPEQLADHRPELPHPEHVEEDVQETPVQVDRRDHRPPVPLHHHRHDPGHAELQGSSPARGQKPEQVEGAEDRPRIHRQSDDVENDGHRRDQAGEVDGQPQLAEPRGEPPHPGLHLAAKGTARFGAAYQLVALGTEDGGHSVTGVGYFWPRFNCLGEGLFAAGPRRRRVTESGGWTVTGCDASPGNGSQGNRVSDVQGKRRLRFPQVRSPTSLKGWP